MEKFYELIKSDTIRENCIKKNIKLSTIQCLFLVWISTGVPMEKKHKLYEEIMATMPEPEISKEIREDLDFQEGLYDILKNDMENEKKAAKRFMKDADKPVYQCLYDELEPLEKKIRFNTDFLEDEIEEDDREITNTRNHETACFSCAGELVCVSSYHGLIDSILTNDDIIKSAMIPTPFKSGDILCFDHFFKNKPCVYISNIITEKNTYNPMCVSVYICGTDGVLERYSIDYDKLTAYKGDLDKRSKILKVLSDFLKKKVNLETLLNAYLVHINRIHEMNVNRRDRLDCDYMKRIMELQEE